MMEREGMGGGCVPVGRVHVYPVHWTMTLDAEMTAWRQLDQTFLSHDPYDNRYVAVTVSPTDRLETILNHPRIYVRAMDLITFLNRCPPEALKENYKVIVDTIFRGWNGSFPWDLSKRRDKTEECVPIMKLLAPNGPLVTLALRLMDDHNFLLEYPVEELPLSLKRRLLENDVPSFLSSKLGVVQSVSSVDRTVRSLLLNPFEYLIFSFASVHVGLRLGHYSDYLDGWAVLHESLYTAILEDYLQYYFPCDGSNVPPHHFNHSGQTQESVFMANSLLRQQRESKGGGLVSLTGPKSPDQQSWPKLIKKSFLLEQNSNVNSRENLFLTTHPSAYKEVWRSETILHTFMELWMWGYSGPMEKVEENFMVSSLQLCGGLPSVEVIKCVRMVVRHLHFFVNCIKGRAMHPMEEIKKTSIPIFQRKLYAFLRHLFLHWPLDNSFRIVYETWLSYIQPWRYVPGEKPNSKSFTSRTEEFHGSVDRRWSVFVMENILFYSKIYSQMLTRLQRADLSATKNALMFFRLAKIYSSHESFKTMLKDIEAAILASDSFANLPQSPTIHTAPKPMRFSSPSSFGRDASMSGFFGNGGLSPALTPLPSPGPGLGTPNPDTSAFTSSSKMTLLKQFFKEAEGPAFVYQPIFSYENRKKIEALIAAAQDARKYLIDSADSSTKRSGSGSPVVRFFRSLWTEATQPTNINNFAMSATDWTKAADQLDMACHQFAMFYDIPPPTPKAPESPQPPTYRRRGTANKVALPTGVLMDLDLIPYGSPDEKLIGSDEFGPLVKICYWISQFLNYLLEDRIDVHYFSPTWTGRFYRAVFAEPLEYIYCHRPSGPGPRRSMKTARYLPPRVYLRPLASHVAISFAFLGLIICFLCNFSKFNALGFLIFLYTVYVTFVATSEPVNKLDELLHLRNLYVGQTEG